MFESPPLAHSLQNLTGKLGEPQGTAGFLIKKRWKSQVFMGKFTLSMVIFHSYVTLW
jgi:hypothetical protein